MMVHVLEMGVHHTEEVFLALGFAYELEAGIEGLQ